MAAEIADTLTPVERKHRISGKAWEAERPIEEAMMFSVLLNEIDEFEFQLDEEAITMAFAAQKGNDGGERLGDTYRYLHYLKAQLELIDVGLGILGEPPNSELYNDVASRLRLWRTIVNAALERVSTVVAD
ncbi:hypothetical protein [Thermoanaerobacterium sp. DL9XJH110]|uniref:hypothetical protein n=1 Tax=Thermoanaerobacterium sp. DL9XJH110 TaxID=3386643 RepID=UPI003BB4C556